MPEENISLRIRKRFPVTGIEVWVIDVLERGIDTGEYIGLDGTKTLRYIDYPTKLDALNAAS